MIDYQLYCQIKAGRDADQLTAPQIAQKLNLSQRTVVKWLAVEKYHQRQALPRKSKLEPFKGQIVRWLQAHPYTATQILLRLRESGYMGGISIVKDYVHQVRRPERPPS